MAHLVCCYSRKLLAMAMTFSTDGGAEGEVAEIPEGMYYDYEELYSRPVTTADSNIPENLLHLSYP